MTLPTAMTFGVHTVPQTDGSGNLRLGAKGDWLFMPPQIVGNNGQGLAVVAGYASATWTWDLLNNTDYVWLTNTLLGGAASVRFTSGINIYNDQWVRTTYASCIVHRPTADKPDGAYHTNVVLRVERIVSL